MAPQPFLPTFEKYRFVIGANEIQSRPKMAIAVMDCISIWSYVDNEIGGLFGILLGNESPAAHSVFTILRRWTNQRQALDAASQILTGDDHLAYRALMVEFGSLETQRNALAHGCFGVCPEEEDMLFVISVEHHILWQADVIPKHLKRIPVPEPHQGLKEKLMVYRLKDLAGLHAEMERHWWDLFHFNGYLRKWPGSDGSQWRERFAMPHIQQRIAALPQKT